ncbi:MAG: hypothetical protein MUQ00_13340 [Candidatus Aminicenantes bacterium]|nr:hypothetical protein [Candidatus Aminicenantes bacterium]
MGEENDGGQVAHSKEDAAAGWSQKSRQGSGGVVAGAAAGAALGKRQPRDEALVKKTRNAGRAKANPQNRARTPEKTAPWPPEAVETGFPGASGRAAATEFRAFSCGKSPEDAMPAVRWLTRLRGFKKDEAECWIFMCERIFDHAKLFVDSADRQVLFIVEKMFRAYTKVRQRKETRRRKLFTVIGVDVEEQEEESLPMDWSKPSKAEQLPPEMQSIKKAADYLKTLKKYPELLEQLRVALLK